MSEATTHRADNREQMHEAYHYPATSEGGIGVRRDLVVAVVDAWSLLSASGDPTRTLHSVVQRRDVADLAWTAALAVVSRVEDEREDEDVENEDEPRVPAIGERVHYVSYGTPGGEFPKRCRAAVVTEVGTQWSDGHVVGLCVLNPTGLFFHALSDGGCKYHLGDTWDDVNDTSDRIGQAHWCGNERRVFHGGTWHPIPRLGTTTRETDDR